MGDCDEEPEADLGQLTFLRAGVLAGGASLPIAVATRSAGASSPQGRPEATSASSAASGQTRQITG